MSTMITTQPASTTTRRITTTRRLAAGLAALLLLGTACGGGVDGDQRQATASAAEKNPSCFFLWGPMGANAGPPPRRPKQFFCQIPLMFFPLGANGGQHRATGAKIPRI